MHETKKKLGKEICIYSGDLINYKQIESIKDRTELTNFLKNITYSLKNSSK